MTKVFVLLCMFVQILYGKAHIVTCNVDSNEDNFFLNNPPGQCVTQACNGATSSTCLADNEVNLNCGEKSYPTTGEDETYDGNVIGGFCFWTNAPTNNPNNYTGFCAPQCGVFQYIGSDDTDFGSCNSKWVGNTCISGFPGETGGLCKPTKCLLLYNTELMCSSSNWYYFKNVCNPYFAYDLSKPEKECIEDTNAPTTAPTSVTATVEKLESHSTRRKVWRGVAIAFIVLSVILISVLTYMNTRTQPLKKNVANVRYVNL